MVKRKKIIRFQNLVQFIANRLPGIMTLQLVKTIYFLELEYRIKFGENLTEVPIVRLPMGPASSNYKNYLNRLRNEQLITTKKTHQSTQFFSTKTNHFTTLELEVFDPIIDLIDRIRKQNPNGATEIIKGLSYQTFPMERFVLREKQDCKMHIGWKVFQDPYFTKDDFDTLANERRILRDHLRKARPFGKEDALIDIETMQSFLPFQRLTNQSVLEHE